MLQVSQNPVHVFGHKGKPPFVFLEKRLDVNVINNNLHKNHLIGRLRHQRVISYIHAVRALPPPHPVPHPTTPFILLLFLSLSLHRLMSFCVSVSLSLSIPLAPCSVLYMDIVDTKLLTAIA